MSWAEIIKWEVTPCNWPVVWNDTVEFSLAVQGNKLSMKVLFISINPLMWLIYFIKTKTSQSSFSLYTNYLLQVWRGLSFHIHSLLLLLEGREMSGGSLNKTLQAVTCV